jgi:hypothetical protein
MQTLRLLFCNHECIDINLNTFFLMRCDVTYMWLFSVLFSVLDKGRNLFLILKPVGAEVVQVVKDGPQTTQRSG